MLERESFGFDLLMQWFFSDNGYDAGMRLAVLRHLSYRNVVDLMTVNHHFYQILKDQDYWKEQSYRYFPFNNESSGSEEDLPEANLTIEGAKHNIKPSLSCFDHFKAQTKNRRQASHTHITGVFSNPNINDDVIFLQTVKPLDLSYRDVSELNRYPDFVKRIGDESKAFLFSIVKPYFHQGSGFDYTKVCEYSQMTFFQYVIQFNCTAFVESISNQTFKDLAPQYPSFIDILIVYPHQEMLTLLHKKGLSLDTVGTCGQTLLHMMANKRDNGWMEFLCELGVDVNVYNHFGETAVHCAVKSGNKKTFLFLMNRGANLSLLSLKKIKKTDENKDHDCFSEGSTLLHYAVSGERIDIMKMVINYIRSTETVDPVLAINAVNAAGYSPLAVAVQMGNETLFDLLLKEGAVLTSGPVNVHGDSMLQLAIRGKNFNIVNRLMQLVKFDFRHSNAKGETILHFMARYFRELKVGSMINLCCRAGMDLEAKTNDTADIPGATPLHYAVFYNNLRAVKQLLHEFVNVDATTADGRTAIYLFFQSLHFPNQAESMAMRKRLIKYNPDINLGKYHYSGENKDLKEKNGDSLVHTVVRNSISMVLSSVLKLPYLDINTQNANGDTPLHVSATLDDFEHTKILLRAGAKMDIVNYNNETPLAIFAKSNQLRGVNFFYDKGRQLAKGSLPGMTQFILGHVHIKETTLRSLFEAMPNLETIRLIGIVKIITSPDFSYQPQKNAWLSLKTIDISAMSFDNDDSYRSLELILASSPNVSSVVCGKITPQGVKRLFEIYQALATNEAVKHRYSQSMVTQFVTGRHGFFATQSGEKRPTEGLDSPSKRTRLG